MSPERADARPLPVLANDLKRNSAHLTVATGRARLGVAPKGFQGHRIDLVSHANSSLMRVPALFHITYAASIALHFCHEVGYRPSLCSGQVDTGEFQNTRQIVTCQCLRQHTALSVLFIVFGYFDRIPNVSARLLTRAVGTGNTRLGIGGDNVISHRRQNNEVFIRHYLEALR